jgi:hypothetical protein
MFTTLLLVFEKSSPKSRLTAVSEESSTNLLKEDVEFRYCLQLKSELDGLVPAT